MAWLKRVARLGLVKAREVSADGRFALKSLPEIDVAIVSDRVIAKVHAQFMNLPDPTDVITFDHGEIVVSAETALANAPGYGHCLEEEIALYVIHGFLHLNGFEDATALAASRMHKIQGEILKWCVAQTGLPQKGPSVPPR
jgi:probable rRNA maturation factor